VWSLDSIDLLKFSYQVAQGMEFLASKNVIFLSYMLHICVKI